VLPNTKTLVEKASVEAGQRIVNAGLLKQGDAVIYYNTVPSEGSHVGYHHSAMYVGDRGITCHSTCRYKGLGDSTDDEWHLNGGAIYKYTLIHFSSDDSVEAAVSKALTGWWKVEYAGRTSYCVVLGNGSARRSQPHLEGRPISLLRGLQPTGFKTRTPSNLHGKRLGIWKSGQSAVLILYLRPS
jgi:hypothetical protein